MSGTDVGLDRRTAAVGSDVDRDVENAGHVTQVDCPPRLLLDVRLRARVCVAPSEAQLSVRCV